jgi:mycofactocin precursor
MLTMRNVQFAQNQISKEQDMEKKFEAEKQEQESCNEEPQVLEEIQIEELAIDGICGVY